MSAQPQASNERPVSPMASADPWDFVAADYEQVTRKFLEAFSRSGLARLHYDKGTRAIDIACGPGTTTLMLAPAVRHVTAVDFSTAMLDELRRDVAAVNATNVAIIN